MKFKKNKQDNSEQFELIFEDEMPKKENSIHSPTALTSEEIISFGKDESSAVANSSTGALEALKKRLATASVENGIPTEEVKPEPKPEPSFKETVPEAPIPKSNSLFDKCKPYIVNDSGEEEVNSEPLYKLQSVAEILKSDSEKFLEQLSKNYDITFEEASNTAIPTIEEAEPSIEKSEPEEAHEAGIFEEKMPSKKIVISDLDYSGSFPAIKPDSKEPEGTITFTPVSSADSTKTDIKISTHTKAIDLTDELVKLPDSDTQSGEDELKLEQSEFEDFVPKQEYATEADIKHLKRKFMVSKKNTFLVSVFSFLSALILAFAKLPFMTEILLTHTLVGMIVCSSIAGISVLLNVNMFVSLTKIFSKKGSPDVLASLASIFTLFFAVMGIIKEENILDLLLLLSITLFFRSLGKFQNASVLLSNFTQISSTAQKKAVKLINDPAITFAMAKNSIEGDVLIAAAQKTNKISDFMKYSTYGSFLGGRIPLVTVFSLLLSIICGLAGAFYFDGAFYGIYSAAAIMLLTALPSVFLIDTLPLYKAAKRLNKMGAMIMGKIGAEHLEMANAVVLSSNDIFPRGTVTLHQMKVLSENTLDDTIVRAASLTEYMGSTLAPIFKQIASTGNYDILPDTDTVKYEDRMGVSGWVDNRLLFIGNRALMEAHGIEVPSLEVDRKILRQGYFPVYVATRERACALLIIQYNVNREIANELRNLSRIGITLLINNTDPNLNEAMISDYFGLYEDSVKVMSAAGCHMYKNTVAPTEKAAAPAAYRGSSLALAAIMNCATKIKRSNVILTVLYILSAVLGALIFAYTSFGGSDSPLSGVTLLIYGIISTVISYFIYLTEQP